MHCELPRQEYPYAAHLPEGSSDKAVYWAWGRCWSEGFKDKCLRWVDPNTATMLVWLAMLTSETHVPFAANYTSPFNDLLVTIQQTWKLS